MDLNCWETEGGALSEDDPRRDPNLARLLADDDTDPED